MAHDAAQEFLSQIPSVRNDLPFSPALLQTLFAQTGMDSVSSMEEVAETIAHDQGLTARILTLANSAFYGLQSEVASVRRAAAVLGMREIRNLVLALGVRGLTRRRPLPASFDLPVYWRHQVRAAVMAREVARRARLTGADDLFTAGLLHDLGKLVTALYRPEAWEGIRALAREEDLADVVAEEHYWGLDHAVIGSLVLKSWDFPPALTEPLNWHHSPELAGDYRPQATVLCLADLLSHEQEPEAEPDPAAEAGRHMRVKSACRDLGLDAAVLRAELDEVANDEAVGQFAAALG
ncbi:MAG: HDOD domain-containing protein [Desulfovibrionaceae bacterium]